MCPDRETRRPSQTVGTRPARRQSPGLSASDIDEICKALDTLTIECAALRDWASDLRAALETEDIDEAIEACRILAEEEGVRLSEAADGPASSRGDGEPAPDSDTPGVDARSVLPAGLTEELIARLSSNDPEVAGRLSDVLGLLEKSLAAHREHGAADDPPSTVDLSRGAS